MGKKTTVLCNSFLEIHNMFTCNKGSEKVCSEETTLNFIILGFVKSFSFRNIFQPSATNLWHIPTSHKVSNSYNCVTEYC
jgi:hypothetical protein